MWAIEAYRKSDDELEWEVDLDDVQTEILEQKLGFKDLSMPDSYRLTAEQARLALRTLTSRDPDELLANEQALSFYISMYADE